MPEPAELVYGTELFAAAADIAYPEGYFIRTLSEAQLASIWGQETLWLTDAENEVIYDGSGVPWIVRLTVQTADGTLTAELSPEHLPPACLAEPAEETCEVFGVPVAAAAGPSHAVVSFVRGEGADAVGMRITMEGELPPLQELPRGSSRSRWSRTARCSCISSKRRTFPSGAVSSWTRRRPMPTSALGAISPRRSPSPLTARTASWARAATG